MKFRARWLCLLSVVALLCSMAWAAVTADQIANRIRSRITSKWKSANLKVHVTPHPGNAGLDQGHIRRITVSATSVTMEGVKMTGVRLSADDVVMDVTRLFQTGSVIIKKRRTDSIQCRVGEDDLNRALTFRPNSIQNLRVKLGDGVLTFTGTYKFGIGADLMLQGRMETPDGYKLNFVPTRASVNGVPLPAGPLRIVLSKVNPLIDFRKVPMQPKIDRIIVESGYLAIVG